MRIHLTRRSFLQRISQLGGYAATFSAMDVLGFIPRSQPSDLTALPVDLGRGKSVLILGAGIAGLVSALELTTAGFHCTVLEARARPGGRNFTLRNGARVDFVDGTTQTCEWSPSIYQNAGPARIPSTHTNLLNYCRRLGVRMETEVNSSRSALLQSPEINGGRPVAQRQVLYDTRGILAELLSKAVHQHALDEDLSSQDISLLLDYLRTYGDLDATGKYKGSTRGGYRVPPMAGPSTPEPNDPLQLHDLLAADFARPLSFEDEYDWQATMLQPVGGMDCIAYALERALPAGTVRYGAEVQEIVTSETGPSVAYRQGNSIQRAAADYCICTLPLSILAQTRNNFSSETKQAFGGMMMVSLYKIAWESPRFWETDNNIYGGLSYPKGPVDTIWYPSAGFFSPTGALCAGYGTQRDDTAGTPRGGTNSGVPNAFGRLPTMKAKLDASRAAVEMLHPGRGHLLTKPIFVDWLNMPYSLGAAANSFAPSSQSAYLQLNKPEGRTNFASDYLSRLVGWQEGAVLSAHSAIARIAEQVSAS